MTKNKSAEKELLESIAQLNLTDRIIIGLRLCARLKFKQIGHIIGMSPTNVTSRYSQTLKKLVDKQLKK